MADAPRILVIRRRYLGDIVLLGSVFRNLRLHWPDAQIALLAERNYASIGLLHPDVNRVRAFPAKLSEWPRFIRELRGTRFTHVLDFDNTDKTALVTRLTGAPVRVNYQRELIPCKHRWVYTGSAVVSNDFYRTHHITETYLKLLEPAGVPVTSRKVRLTPSADDVAVAQRFTGGPRRAAPGQRPRVLVHPGSRSRFRIWPAERFAAVCDQLQDELDAQIFLIAGPGERAVARDIRDHAQAHVVLMEEPFTTGQFAAFIAQFDLMLCHDSGPMHIAAGVGTKVVALFGSQNAAIWRPVGDHHTILQTELPCTCLPDTPTPCVRDDSYRSYCVRKLSVETVFSAVAQTLGKHD